MDSIFSVAYREVEVLKSQRKVSGEGGKITFKERILQVRVSPSAVA